MLLGHRRRGISLPAAHCWHPRAGLFAHGMARRFGHDGLYAVVMPNARSQFEGRSGKRRLVGQTGVRRFSDFTAGSASGFGSSRNRLATAFLRTTSDAKNWQRHLGRA